MGSRVHRQPDERTQSLPVCPAESDPPGRPYPAVRDRGAWHFVARTAALGDADPRCRQPPRPGSTRRWPNSRPHGREACVKLPYRHRCRRHLHRFRAGRPLGSPGALQGTERARRSIAVGGARSAAPDRTCRGCAGGCGARGAWHHAGAERDHPAPWRALGAGGLRGQSRRARDRSRAASQRLQLPGTEGAAAGAAQPGARGVGAPRRARIGGRRGDGGRTRRDRRDLPRGRRGRRDGDAAARLRQPRVRAAMSRHGWRSDCRVSRSAPRRRCGRSGGNTSAA